MSNEQASTREAGNQTPVSDSNGGGCCSGSLEAGEFSGGKMEGMMQACPCSGMLKRHRVAAYAALIGIGLVLLVLQAGWILGVVAFFRTI